MTTNQNSTETLREEILAEARKKSEEIVNNATRDAEAIIKNANAEAERIRQESLNQANTEAKRLGELILATVPVETGRLRAGRIESLLMSVYDEAHQKIMDHEGFDYRKTVIALASSAIDQMTGFKFVAKVSEADSAILDNNLAEDIAQQVNRPVSITILYQSEITGGGVIIEDAVARQLWDNRLTKRLERLWPEIRRELAVRAAFIPTKMSTL